MTAAARDAAVDATLLAWLEICFDAEELAFVPLDFFISGLGFLS